MGALPRKFYEFDLSKNLHSGSSSGVLYVERKKNSGKVFDSGLGPKK